MNIAAFIREECIQVGGDFRDKDAVLQTIARLARKSPAMADFSEEQIYAGLLEREKLSSTGFGQGIGIPHAAFEKLDQFVVGMIVVPEGFDFEALDGKPSKLLVFIMVPAAQRDQHIRLLSKISNILKEPQNVSEILANTTPTAVRESFLRHTKTPVSEEQKEQNLFHIIIQNEDQFEDVLNVFTEISNCAVSVIEANNARAYLHALPLFSSFWNQEDKGFCRVIIAAVNRSLSNEVIRAINLLIEEARDKTGILILAQEIFYANGTLNL